MTKQPRLPLRGIGIALVLVSAIVVTPAHAEHRSSVPTTDPTSPTPTPADPAGRSPRPSSGDSVLLPEGGRGEAAVDQLGDQLPVAARRSGLDAEAYETALVEDASTRAGRDGRMYVVDPVPTDTEPGAAHLDDDAAADPAFPLPPTADAYVLHSQPVGRRKRTIYLDFDGYTLAEDSFWVNDIETPLDPGVYGGVERSPEELREFVVRVWQIVAERWAPFDVDVTTQHPGEDALNRTSDADDTWGTHVVFTDEHDLRQQACNTCSGVALVGVHDDVDDGIYEPAWAFTESTGDPGRSAQLANHEIGHTFGLTHDGRRNLEYDQGADHWIPVMGGLSFRPVQQFSRGEYAGATNKQDDLAVIAASGSPLEADDWGDDHDPSELEGTFVRDLPGMITSQADEDTFALTTSCTRDLTATARGIGTGTSLDLKVDIINDADNRVLASDDPRALWEWTPDLWEPTGVDASATVADAPAGRYRVRVDGSSVGDPTDEEGSSTYGSLGRYVLRIEGCGEAAEGAVLPAPTEVRGSAPTPGTNQIRLEWQPPVADETAGDVTGYTIRGPSGILSLPAASIRAWTAAGFTPGRVHRMSVEARYAAGNSTGIVRNVYVPTWNDVGAPALDVNVGKGRADISWTRGTNPGQATVTNWRIVVKRGGSQIWSGFADASMSTWDFPSLIAGDYVVQLYALTRSDGGEAVSDTGSISFRVISPPWVPPMLDCWWGMPGDPITSLARWDAPGYDGGSPITGYRVYAYRLDANDRLIEIRTSPILPGSARYYDFPLPAGKVKFRVMSFNAHYSSSLNEYSDVNMAR